MVVDFSVDFSNTSQNFALDFPKKSMPVDVIFEENSKDFCACFSSELEVTIAQDIAPYIGNYTVTPKVTEQTLETGNMRMAANLKIEKIPYVEVNNSMGGTTVYIGSEVI